MSKDDKIMRGRAPKAEPVLRAKREGPAGTASGPSIKTVRLGDYTADLDWDWDEVMSKIKLDPSLMADATRFMHDYMNSQFFGDQTVTRRFRGRIGDDSRGGWDPREREAQERLLRKTEHLMRKEEEGDSQAWHLIPPLDRMKLMSQRYGHEAFVGLLSRVLDDMLDLDSVLDVLACELDMYQDRNSPFLAPDPRVRVKCPYGEDHEWRDVTTTADRQIEMCNVYECGRCGARKKERAIDLRTGPLR